MESNKPFHVLVRVFECILDIDRRIQCINVRIIYTLKESKRAFSEVMNGGVDLSSRY